MFFAAFLFSEILLKVDAVFLEFSYNRWNRLYLLQYVEKIEVLR